MIDSIENSQKWMLFLQGGPHPKDGKVMFSVCSPLGVYPSLVPVPFGGGVP